MSNRATVDVTATVPLSPDACWSILRQFCTPWHPAIQTMTAEEGGSIRAFTVAGDDAIYKERMTWLSDSDRSLRYTHLQGIAGALRYDARISVTEAGEAESYVRWQAEIEADPARAREIASGTEQIFRMGLASLQGADVPHLQRSAPTVVSKHTQHLPTSPALSVLSSDRTDGTLCLFLHGIGGQKENWIAQLDAVGPLMQAAALDLRGYGNSNLGPQQSTIEAYCADILAVCDTLGAQKLILCGLSYGAWIATSFAMRHPDRLAGLILAGGCTGMSEADAAERTAFRQSREVPLSQGQTPADFAGPVVDVIAGPLASAELRAALAASMAAIPVATYRDALTCFTDPSERFNFSHLTMPVLFMTGAQDKLAPPTEIRSVAERVWASALKADVRFEELAHAGHVCNLEQPAAFNVVLREFLTRVVA